MMNFEVAKFICTRLANKNMNFKSLQYNYESFVCISLKTKGLQKFLKIYKDTREFISNLRYKFIDCYVEIDKSIYSGSY